MTTRRKIGLGLLLLVGVMALYRWLKPPSQFRPALFSAYSDNFAGMWGLTLYRDGGFDETLPASNESGRFRLSGDTVVLRFDDSARFPLAAYCIDRPARKIYKLRRGSGRWLADDHGRDWSQIYVDKLPR